MRTFGVSLLLSILCGAYFVRGLPVSSDTLAKRDVPLIAGFSGADLALGQEKRAVPARAAFIITDPTSDTTELAKGESAKAKADK